MSHTKGPWKAEILRAGAFNITGGHEFYYGVCSRGSSVEHMESECGANARLIAAAPELLQALEIIARGETEIFDEDLQQMVVVAMDEEEMSEIAETAIEKTTEWEND